MLARCGCFEKPKKFLEMRICVECQVFYAAYQTCCFGIDDRVLQVFEVFSASSSLIPFADR